MGRTDMRKPLTSSPFASGTVNRFGRSGLGGGPAAVNSNARIISGAGTGRSPAAAASDPVRGSGGGGGSIPVDDNLGLNSERSRERMVQRLVEQGITDQRVLAAMRAVPRHLFVDEGLASRAYEDAALPIGHEQTISQPWVVARMVSLALQGRALDRVLEVGAGCGYQAVVLAHVAKEVHAIERVRGLYELARQNLAKVKAPGRVRLAFGDGMAGLPASAPFDAILIAAAGLTIPKTLLEQLAPGGRLIAPEGGTDQRLVLVERTGATTWKRQELDAVRFVPLRPGTQY